MTTPMNTIIVFSHLRWNFVYQRPQHLLTRLARRYRVVFVEEPVRSDGAARLEVVTVEAKLQVVRPHTPLAPWGFHDEQLACIGPLLVAELERQGIDDYGVWFYTPMALPLLALLQPSLVIYDCMDELSAFLGAPPELCEREARLLDLADVVLAGGPSLYESKRQRRADVLCLPSSVDARHFAAGRGEAAGDAMQAGLPRPRLGFFGVIDERMDLDLIDRLARAESGWQIVMVGPVVKIDPATLPRSANVHWLGPRSYEQLPALVAGWDVGLMPFALNEATRFISPTKTLEYMAAGKPVVSTAVRDVVTLYGDAVEIGADADGFIAACRRVLAEGRGERARRQHAMTAAVAKSSWDRTAAEVERAIAAVIDGRARLMRSEAIVDEIAPLGVPFALGARPAAVVPAR